MAQVATEPISPEATDPSATIEPESIVDDPAEFALPEPNSQPELTSNSDHETNGETAVDSEPVVSSETETNPPVAQNHTTDDGFTRDALTRLLEEVIELKGSLQNLSVPMTAAADITPAEHSTNETLGITPDDEITELKAQLADANAHASTMQRHCDELSTQNEDLAAQIAGMQVQDSIGGSHEDAGAAADILSWDQRKELIYQQLEDDAFNAEDFLTTIQASQPDDACAKRDDPAAMFEDLFERSTKLQAELDRRNTEIDELRLLLEQKQDLAANGFGAGNDEVAVGAAAIAQMLDHDELVQQERERLQEMQVEWEEKFRQLEISTSLERAKLSRERQQLATKNAELEEQLEHLQRENREADPTTGKKRRWLAELGLTLDK